MSKREIFDKAALNIITYLEQFNEINNVNFKCFEGIASHESLLWEKKNSPFLLPGDLKKFYDAFNGVTLTWNTIINNKPIEIGIIKINKLENLIKYDIDGTFLSNPYNDIKIDAIDSSSSAAFILDSHPSTGDIVLLYRKASSSSSTTSQLLAVDNDQNTVLDDPEVWFIDRCSRWHFVAKSFTHYFRLLVVHCGIHGWQFAYTPEGLPPTTQHWMSIFCKERLIIDKAWNDRLMRSTNSS